MLYIIIKNSIATKFISEGYSWQNDQKNISICLFFLLFVGLWLLGHHKQLLGLVIPQANCDRGHYKHVTSLNNTWKQARKEGRLTFFFKCSPYESQDSTAMMNPQFL